MNHLIVFFALLCFSFSSYCQTESKKKERHFGLAINSGVAISALAININPTGIFYINRHQVELGFGLYPVNVRTSIDELIWSGHLNYKYYPSGINKRFSSYMVTSLSYTQKEGGYVMNYPLGQTDYFIFGHNKFRYISLTGGYGFDIKILKNGYIGSALNVGVFTAGTGFQSSALRKLFEEFGLDVAFRLNIGYRF